MVGQQQYRSMAFNTRKTEQTVIPEESTFYVNTSDRDTPFKNKYQLLASSSKVTSPEKTKMASQRSVDKHAEFSKTTTNMHNYLSGNNNTLTYENPERKAAGILSPKTPKPPAKVAKRKPNIDRLYQDPKLKALKSA